MKNTTMNIYELFYYLLNYLWSKVILNEKVLAVIGGFVGFASIKSAILYVRYDFLALVYGVINACVFAAAGWFIKFLLDRLKARNFRLFKKGSPGQYLIKTFKKHNKKDEQV